MKQTLLRIGLPEKVVLYPNQFREMVAKQPGLPGTLFHYDENGKPANGRPDVRFVGAKGWVGILADEEHADLVYDAMGAAVRAATAYCRQSVRPLIEEREFGLIPLQSPKRYWIREMALKRRWKRSREADIATLVTERLLASIEAIADKYGMDCPTAEQLGLLVDVKRNLGMPLVTSGCAHLEKKEYVTLVNADFLIHADLKGFWFAGNLTARGYGRIGSFVAPSISTRQAETSLAEVE